MSPGSVPAPRISVCGIGASAGGIAALEQFFRALAPDLGLAYVVVVHLAPDRKSEMPAIISRWTSMPVIQVADHQLVPLAKDHVFVIAPDRKLEITDTSVGASSFEQRRGHRTAIDLFFRSLAEAHGDGFAVVLSGTGSDGALGAKAVKARGGIVLVQDPSEAGHDGMPRATIATGVADVILPARELAQQLARLARDKQGIAPVVRATEGLDPIAEDEEKALRGVLETLRRRTGHDFSKYKRTTILRRLTRRMQLSHRLTISDYQSFLLARPGEVQCLFEDLLISVTTFFRDPEMWASLQALVIAPLVEASDPDQQIRVWVPACASGEEAYTLAILFTEEFERQKIQRSLVIFASDVDEASLVTARDGLYPEAIVADVSATRLERYFALEDSHYRVASHIRECVVFAAHNLLRDPPFSRLHLVSCRNLLIYLDRELQDQVIGLLRYALREGGHLVLGLSETADEELFQSLDKKHRIYAANPRGDGTRLALPELLAIPSATASRPPGGASLGERPTGASLHGEMLEAVAAPSIVVDDRWNVLHVSASAARFFQQSAGPLARRATDLVRPELRDELHTLLHRAIESDQAQLGPFVAVRFNGDAHRVGMIAQRHVYPEDERRYVLVTFLDAGEATGETAPAEQEPSAELVRNLRAKLRHAEQRMDGMRDDHYVTNEDLRAANEELQSLNEEYRSTTEELETSKEELQSINEELQTVNNELKLKLEEVSRAHSDLENFMGASDVAMLFLGLDLRIKRFTSKLGEIFNVVPRDHDRPIGNFTHALDYADLERDARRVLEGEDSLERQTVSRTGQHYVIRLSPYRKAGDRELDGVVVTFIDVTAIKQAEAALRESERRLESELQVTKRLHAMAMAVATAQSMKAALDHILGAAMELEQAELGNVQLVDAESGQLRIVAQCGFDSVFLERVAAVSEHHTTASARAARIRGLCQIPDVLEDPDFAAYRAAGVDPGYRAVQSAPLIARDGALMGVLSIHFRQPHAFSDRDRQLGELLGRHAADLIASRTQHERVTALNATLNGRTAELEASQERLARQAAQLMEQDRYRQEFLAALSHELRNPMAAIQGAVALVTTPDPASKRALLILERQARHLTRLINDMLDMTRVQHGKLRLERGVLDVRQCALNALESVRRQAEEKGLDFEYDVPADPLFVSADVDRITQAIDNLLRNAVTYTDRGKVTLRVSARGAQASVSVRDTGVGISAEDAARIFDPYRQVAVAGRNGGLGLGLALVKELVEAHGGGVQVESAGPGMGSEFGFTLPLVEPPSPSSAPPPPIVTPPQRHHVMVVDDEADVAEVFSALLESLGQKVITANDGATAIAMARRQRPRVAFLDVSMPGMNGAEVAAGLREHFSPEELLIVAVTGYGKSHAAVKAAAFDRHLLKPVNLHSLAMLLASVPEEPLASVPKDEA